MWTVEYLDLSLPDDRNAGTFALFPLGSKRDEERLDPRPTNRSRNRPGEHRLQRCLMLPFQS